MTAFDSTKNKFMPTDYTALDTDQLIEVIEQGMLSQPQSAALNEMKDRIVKVGNVDDVVNGNGEHVFAKGVRPKHVPIVP